MLNIFGLAAAFASSITWAMGVSIYSDLSQKYPPSTINFTRAWVALPLFLLGLCIEIFRGPQGLSVLTALHGEHIFWLAVSCVASYAVGDVLFMKSTRSSLGASGALAIASIFPVWAAVFGVVFKGEFPEFRSWIGLLLVVGGTAGVILSSRNKKTGEAVSGEDSPALTLRENNTKTYPELPLLVAASFALLTSLFWSLNVYSVSRVQGLSSVLSNSVRMGFAIFLCPILGFFLLGSRKLFLSRSDFKKAFPIFLLEGFGGALLYVYGVSNSPLALGAVLTSLAPVLSVPILYMRHRELPGPYKAASVAIVMGGLWLMIFARA